jgi:uncharacterized protein YggU (UPF0235/DUF167 family)
MLIIVKAKAGAKVAKVERVEQETLPLDVKKALVTYKVSVKESPVNGKANDAIICALAEYFEVSKFRVSLISGPTSKQKVFEIR